MTTSYFNKGNDQFLSCMNRFVKIFLYIQMEYCSGQTLKKYLELNPERNRKEILCMIKKLSEGMLVIHEAGIIHRDLKYSFFIYIYVIYFQ